MDFKEKKEEIKMIKAENIAKQLLRLPPTDDIEVGPILEIMQATEWVVVEPGVWRSWTGLRRRNGEEYHGRVVYLDTQQVYRGRRICLCSVCQSDSEPQHRPN